MTTDNVGERSEFTDTMYMVMRDRGFIAAALRFYKGGLDAAKKRDEGVEINTDEHNEKIAKCEFYLDRFKDQRTLGIDGTPMGDAMTRSTMVASDGQSLEADAVVDLLASVNVHADASVVAAWTLDVRKDAYTYVKHRTVALNSHEKPMPPRPQYIPAAWYSEIERAFSPNTVEEPAADVAPTKRGRGRPKKGEGPNDAPAPEKDAPRKIADAWQKLFALTEKLTGINGPDTNEAEFALFAREVVPLIQSLPVGFPATRDIAAEVAAMAPEEGRTAKLAALCAEALKLVNESKMDAAAGTDGAAAPDAVTEAPGAPEAPGGMSSGEVEEWVGAGPWGVQAYQPEGQPPSNDWEVVRRNADNTIAEALPRVFADLKAARAKAARLNRMRDENAANDRADFTPPDEEGPSRDAGG